MERYHCKMVAVVDGDGEHGKSVVAMNRRERENCNNPVEEDPVEEIVDDEV